MNVCLFAEENVANGSRIANARTKENGRHRIGEGLVGVSGVEPAFCIAAHGTAVAMCHVAFAKRDLCVMRLILVMK
jgi:hypothetical protein